MKNTVAIVGRPNVGKSTLYNRMVGHRHAIVDDQSGVTRDRQYGVSDWNGKQFNVIDTGGFVHGSEDVFESAIREQVIIAIEESSVIVFTVDCHTGITDLDQEIADLLRRTEKPVVLAVNKVDDHNRSLDAAEFWSMGFEDTFFVASNSGSGTGELMDKIAEYISDDFEQLSDLPKIAIIGQPNVGKSSLTNALLGEDRNIVTDQSGTTRDSIHSIYNKFGHEFMLIDTAGIRKKAKVHENLEFYSVMRALNALDNCDVCLLMIDATLGVESQDLSIFRVAQKRHKGIVILINKWDLMDKETNTARDFEEEVRRRFAPFRDFPIVFISATEKQRILKAVEAAMQVYENRNRRIKTSKLNDVMLDIIDRHEPPAHRGKFIKIKFVKQLPLAYPAFAFFCNHPKHIKDSYKQFLENQLRKHFDFSGVPIGIFFREK